MSFVTMHQALTESASHVLFPELSVVQTLGIVFTDEGRPIPTGSRGTVVGIWGNGQAYEVEFVRPIVGVAKIRVEMLEAV